MKLNKLNKLNKSDNYCPSWSIFHSNLLLCLQYHSSILELFCDQDWKTDDGLGTA